MLLTESRSPCSHPTSIRAPLCQCPLGRREAPVIDRIFKYYAINCIRPDFSQNYPVLLKPDRSHHAPARVDYSRFQLSYFSINTFDIISRQSYPDDCFMYASQLYHNIEIRTNCLIISKIRIIGAIFSCQSTPCTHKEERGCFTLAASSIKARLGLIFL